MRIYFETSAVNWFFNGRTVGDAIATKSFQNVRGKYWWISPVTLWEILLTSDDTYKNEIIFFCQHLFEATLLPSPEELIVDFIRQGCPTVEMPRQMASRSQIAITWKDLCKNKAKVFSYDKDELKNRIQLISSFTKLLHKVVRGEKVCLLPKAETDGIDITLEGFVNRLSFVKNGEIVSGFEKKLYKLSIFYIMFVLCSEIGLQNDPIKEFWKAVGIKRTIDRIHYTFSKYEVLVHRGPFVEMALMTLCQSTQKFSRGMFFDSLHSLYLPYVDVFLTNDTHFKNMENMKYHPEGHRVHKIDEVPFSTHERENQIASTIIAT